ncbi:MAG: hypothetical protein WBE76_26390 [Terracidiphilus sp.]
MTAPGNDHKSAPQSAPLIASKVDLTFPHHWHAQILPARPAILPARHFVYPRDVEEIERGALEVLVRPGASGVDKESKPSRSPGMGPFLATCALGFRDPIIPTGLWSAPNPCEICAVSGGYAYLIDTTAPERFTMIPFRPVLEVRPLRAENLLLFVGHRAIIAWGRDGQAWQSEKLSDEGVTVTGVENFVLHGEGWTMTTDKEAPFALDLRTGQRIAPARPSQL